MTLDSSALVAILVAEARYLDLVDRVLSSRRGKPSFKEVQRLVEELGVTVVPFGEAEWLAAASAYDRYGRGKHPAGLNFGDCLAYAAAATAGDALLFVGADFTKTDIRRA